MILLTDSCSFHHLFMKHFLCISTKLSLLEVVCIFTREVWHTWNIYICKQCEIKMWLYSTYLSFCSFIQSATSKLWGKVLGREKIQFKVKGVKDDEPSRLNRELVWEVWRSCSLRARLLLHSFFIHLAAVWSGDSLALEIGVFLEW
jgi:hypothetical protein